ncbi:MAG: thioredoxin family protein [Planctomycetes bacterium]|nr:thioredoxin family protein [Planctomycetota bacterium]
MKRFALLAVPAVLGALVVSSYAGDKGKGGSKLPEGYNWETSYEAARLKAAEQGKLMFVDFYTQTCPHCVAMDKNSFPADSVKKFLEPILVMKVDCNAGKDSVKLAKDFAVNAYPTLVMIKPNGETLKRIEGGLETPDQFTTSWTNEFWNAYVNAQNAKPQDGKAMATNLAVLVTWFPASEMGKRAVDAVKQSEGNPDFKAAWDEITKTTERENLSAKADAQTKLGKKKEAIETYKVLAMNHAGTKEGDAAAALLKKAGIKLDPPAAGGDAKK